MSGKISCFVIAGLLGLAPSFVFLFNLVFPSTLNAPVLGVTLCFYLVGGALAGVLAWLPGEGSVAWRNTLLASGAISLCLPFAALIRPDAITVLHDQVVLVAQNDPAMEISRQMILGALFGVAAIAGAINALLAGAIEIARRRNRRRASS